MVDKQVGHLSDDKLELSASILSLRHEIDEAKQKVNELERFHTMSKRREANCLDFLSNQLNKPALERKALIERAMEHLVGS